MSSPGDAGDEPPPAASAPEPRVRRRGFDWPPTAEQVTTAVGEAAITALVLSALIVYPSPGWMPLPVALYSAVAAVVAAAWVYCSAVDPAQPGGVPYGCFTAAHPPRPKERYCRICRKSVPQMDHHCGFLATCIGRRNYVAFATLAIAGTVQHALGVALCVSAALPPWARDGVSGAPLGDGGIVHLSLAAAASAVGAGAFGTLAAFHAYLMAWARMGTVEWIIAQNEALNARLDAAAAARREAAARRAEDADRADQEAARAARRAAADAAAPASTKEEGAGSPGGTKTASSEATPSSLAAADVAVTVGAAALDSPPAGAAPAQQQQQAPPQQRPPPSEPPLVSV